MTANQTREIKEANNVRDEKERERRRKRYKFALVKWFGFFPEDDRLMVEHKDVLKMRAYRGMYEILCDWEPEKVLRAMLRMMKEQ